VAFRGWPPEALDFYEGLEADNSKTYWTEHKAVYDTQVHAPMVELLAELEPEFGAGKIFRPHRDVRFSADKSPYKTAIAAVLAGGGYLQLSARGLAAGRGIYAMAPDQLERYRRAVDAPGPGERLAAIAAALAAGQVEIHGHGALRTAPKGYPKDHPRIGLLRLKGAVAWREWPVAAWLGTAAAKRRVAEFLRVCEPLDGWLAEHVGASVDT
jgi:uncharacterized protein (TIGR02453 family)